MSTQTNFNQPPPEHIKAVAAGKVHGLDENNDFWSMEKVAEFIENQKNRVIAKAKNQIKFGDTISEAQKLIDDDFLSENDISEFLEKNKILEDYLDKVRDMRADALTEALDLISDI